MNGLEGLAGYVSGPHNQGKPHELTLTVEARRGIDTAGRLVFYGVQAITIAKLLGLEISRPMDISEVNGADEGWATPKKKAGVQTQDG